MSASLAATEELGGRGATAPRISLADIEASIVGENWFLAGEACEALGQPASAAASLLTIYLITMGNGFVVLGKSAPMSAANFDAEKGRTFAREDAIRQLWPLMAFSMLDTLAPVSDTPEG